MSTAQIRRNLAQTVGRDGDRLPWSGRLRYLAAVLVASTGLALVGAVAVAPPAMAAPTSCTPTGGFLNCFSYSSTGANETFTVPPGVTSVNAVLKAAGGAPAANGGATGGPGGLASGTITGLTAGRVLNMTFGNTGGFGNGGVGGNGGGTYGRSGNGGGLSAVWSGAAFASDPFLLAGGGGGGGAATSGTSAGGAGGGSTGDAGGGFGGSGGGGGGASGGGAAGTALPGGTAGVQYRGGNGGNGGSGLPGGGGGGSGWWGGGGGSPSDGSFPPGGGGGGSGRIGSDVTGGSLASGGGAAPNSAGSGILQWTPPAAVITGPTGATATQPTFTGTAVPASTVTVREGSTPLCSTVANGAGAWSCLSGTTFTRGSSHTVQASQSDSTGQVYPLSATFSFTVIAAPDAARSTIAASPAVIAADGLATSTVTVTLLTASGAAMTTGGDTVTVGTTLGSVTAPTDNGNGTYTSVLTSSATQGTATVSFTVNGAAGTNTASVLFAGVPDPALSTITAAPLALVANGTSTSTVTVSLIEVDGDPVANGGDQVTITSTLGSVGAVTDNGNGTYRATLTSATAVGTATVSFTVNTVPGTDTAAVDFVAGPADPGTSTIAADPAAIAADGGSRTDSTVTVTALDANGNSAGEGSNLVVTTTLGDISATTDNGDGTYSATLTSGVEGTATVGFTVAGTPGTSTVSVLVTAVPSTANSTIVADPAEITADGASQSTLTVTLVDANGDPVGAGVSLVEVFPSAGTAGPVVNNGDGTYTAVLTSATSAGTATVDFAIDATLSPNEATVTFVAGVPDPATSTIAADPVQLVADGTSVSTATVTLRDANGNPVTVGGDDVQVTSTLGLVGATTDNGDGTYTATLTAPTTPGTATVGFTLNTVTGTDTAAVQFVPGPADPGTSTITATPVELPADGTSESEITVLLLDANGNPVPTGGDTVEITTTAGTIGSTTDNGDGTYSATLTAPTTTGTATVGFLLNTVTATDTVDVGFVPDVPDPTTSAITVSPAELVADGASTSTVTVTVRDANGNPLTTGGEDVEIGSTLGSVGATTDNGNGTYTATLTAPTTPGTATVGFTLNTVAGTDTAAVQFVPGPADPATSTITATPAQLVADGASESEITVLLLDANGNPVPTGGDTVQVTATAGTIGATTDNGDGTYTATLTSPTTVGTATVGFTLNTVTATDTATVAFVPGAADATTSTITAAPASVTADGAATSTVTVTLLDANANPLTAGGDTVAITSTDGTIGATTDDNDGTYTATLTAPTTVGTATVGFTLNTVTGTDTASVTFVAGAAVAIESTISASPTSITANGSSASQITVTLFDIAGNPLTTGGDTVTVASTRGTVGTVTDNSNGSYTAVLTSATTTGPANVSFRVNGATGTDTANVIFVAGPADAGTSTIDATPGSIPADGASTSAVTVTLVDANGNPVPTGGDDVEITTTSGTIGATTDNNDGTYTATLTSPTSVGSATVGFTLNTATGTDTTTVDFAPGAADAAASIIDASPAAIIADGATTSTVTVTVLDANDNPIPAGGDTVVITTTNGTIGATTDNGDGTYAATLTAPTTVGTATLGFTLNTVTGTDTTTVAFTAGAADAETSAITASPGSITADGTSESTITVALSDANGNPITTGGDAVTVTTTSGTAGAVADNGDGTYTAVLTAPTTVGSATVGFTVNTAPGTDTATVAFVAGAADAAASTIAASPTAVTADGTSTSTVTVTLFDTNGNPIDSGGDDVQVNTTAGAIGSVTDEGDGTYTAILTAPTTAAAATVGFVLNTVPGTDTTLVDFVAGAADADQSTIAAAPNRIVADGISTSTVTVILFDANGNPLPAGGDTVAVATDEGTVGAVTDNADGTYTAVLTSPLTVGAATLTFTVNDAPGADTADVQFVASAPDAATSTISTSPTELVADGSASSTVTVTLLDANGNPTGTGGDTVLITTTAGSIGATTDNNDGTYTATLTAPTAAGSATVGFVLNAVAGTDTATVDFVAGAADAATSTIAAAPASVPADGTSTSTVTVTLFDANDNPLATGGDDVQISTTAGTIGAITDNGDGTYTSALTSPTTAGTATVGFTVNSVDAGATTAVTFVAGAADATASAISASPTSITANGSSASQLTVTLFDTNGNPLTTGGDTVTVSAGLGTVGTVTDNGNGTYTAALTSAPTTGTATVSFTVNGAPGTDTATVAFVAGAADAGTSTIEAVPASIPADGISQSVVTVTLLDDGGNPITTGGDDVVVTATAGTIGATVDNGDGTYTATLTSPTTTGSATVGFTLNTATGTDTASVTFVPGPADASLSSIGASALQIAADGTSTADVLVVLFDANDNLVTTGGDTVVIATTLGTVGPVTDNGDGTYSATLTSATTTGTATLSFTVNGAPGGTTATVAFVPGPADAATSTITALPASIIADGASTSTIAVALRDANGNALTTGGDDVTLTTDAGTLGPVIDNGDGTYAGTLTSGTTPGAATVEFTVNTIAATATTSVVFVVGPADAGTSTITAAPTTIESGTGSSTITVTLLDASGNPLAGGGDMVSVTTDLGTATPVSDNGDGTYTSSLSSPSDGTATVRFSVNGAQGAAITTVVVQDTVPPAAPVITSPQDGEVVPPTVLVTGTGEPGATVTVTGSRGAVVCITTVDGSGRWECVPGTGGGGAAALAVGEVTVTAEQADQVGNESAPSAPVTVEVDAEPPAAPVPDATEGTLLTGTAEPGSLVTITDPDGATVCTATTAQDGTFECTPAAAVPDGTLLSLTATDAAGNVSNAALVRVGGPSVQFPDETAAAGTTLVVFGTGFLPGEQVSGVLQSDPVDVGTKTADDDGDVSYAIVLPADLTPGTHTVTLTGAQSGPAVGTFQVVGAPPAPAGGTGSGSGALPATGAEPAVPASIALLLLLAGVVLVTAARLRRRIG
ncbi:invasin domain 3-containing protein [Microbacterium sp. DT81.1]|uniref:invasin domain 3-containing protein n=1 Tax=Microbacterium sp. DT81.1 TaxID=3393413 RepID=UPI003CE9246C